MTELTLDFLQGILKDAYPDVTIRHFEGAPGSQRGDNFISVVYRILLTGTQQLEHGAKETPWRGSIFYKTLPESAALRDMFKSEMFFRNEMAFYNKIWPVLSDFQNQWHNVKNPFKFIPKCYLAQSDVIILENLKDQGFAMPDRKQTLSIERSYVVIKHLAHFHALSLAMKQHNPEGFYGMVNGEDSIHEVFFALENEKFFKSYFQEAACNAIEMVEEELQDFENKGKYLDKLRGFCKEETFFQTMAEFVVPKEPLAVICHGDCWTNNLMFRDGYSDDPEMYLIDFQLARYASPALDLAYFVYQCLDRPQREEHLMSLLKYYVNEMHKRLLELSEGDSMFNTTLNRDVLYELIQDEFKRCSRFGLGVALDGLPAMNCDSNNAPDLYQDEAEAEVIKPQWLQKSDPAIRRKLTDLVKELVDQGWL